MGTSVSVVRRWWIVAGALAGGLFASSVAVPAAESAAGREVGQDTAFEELGAAGRAPAGIRSDELSFPITAGWDQESGFFLSDKNKDSFLLTVGGYIQSRYTLKFRDPRGEPAGRTTTALQGRDESYFDIERARVRLSGYVIDPNINYQILFGGTTDEDGAVGLLDAFVLYKAGEIFSENPDLIAIGAGQFKPYFLRQERTDPTRLQMVDRSLTNEFFNIGRGIGAWVQGDLHWLFWSFAVTNGIESYQRAPGSVDQVPAFVGKLDFNILGHEGGKYEESNVRCDDRIQWTVGLSGMTDVNNGSSTDADTQRFDVYSFGVDTALKWNVFSLQAEYVGRWVDYPGAENPLTPGDGGTHYAHGLYVQGGMFLIPGTLEAVGRVATVWTAGGGSNGNAFEAGPGLNWYISKSHKVKLQTELFFFDISGDLPVQTGLLYDVAGPPPADPDARFFTGSGGYRGGEQGVMWRTQIQLEF
ncbi:MAG: porin [Planctomycetota bacterium]